MTSVWQRYARSMDLQAPSLQFFADADVQVDRPQQVGRVPHGVRRLIPITGGRVTGKGWTARVLPGGADFQMLVTDTLAEELKKFVAEHLSPIAKPDVILFTPSLPKTRSGKIMRRILRKIAEGDTTNLGDTSTLADPSVVNDLIERAKRTA